jgi:hypothetical protein
VLALQTREMELTDLSLPRALSFPHIRLVPDIFAIYALIDGSPIWQHYSRVSTESDQRSIHTRGLGNPWARITPAAISSAELLIEPSGVLGSSEQITTGASRMSSGR